MLRRRLRSLFSNMNCCFECSFATAALIYCSPLLLMWTAKILNKQTLSVQKTLYAQISEDTPISGFYGPGGWWAFLVTLGMTHGHTALAVSRTGRLSSEWDYDLIAASAYIVAAAIDLMHKSKTIARLGDAASQSSLIPALICAERVVSVGTGSSLYSLTISLFFGPRLRSTAVALIPLFFALVSSGFCLHAHNAIFRTAPVIWCTHEEPLFQEIYPFPASVDFLAIVGAKSAPMLEMYGSYRDWVFGLGFVLVFTTGVFLFLAFVWLPVRDFRNACNEATTLGLLFSVLLILTPLGIVVFVFTLVAVAWVIAWICFWWFVYILAFFPQSRFFPPTKTSFTEMDQVSAVLAVLVVAFLRTLHAFRTRSSVNPSSSPESVALLPVSNDDLAESP
ncbi:hypothetical protein R3P38DRAFT_518747 [Favolaschia claudopus]|uniref:Uncharacterized protein n=1 Tax=Favolaschia claudopus TaxID=2862362 RepID=A0AAV9ZBP1_9AGAR